MKPQDVIAALFVGLLGLGFMALMIPAIIMAWKNALSF